MALAKSKEIIEIIFKQYHTELTSHLDKAKTLLALMRIYDSGQILEIALKNLLLNLLPDFVGITRGIIFSSDCKSESKEIDLILYDKRYSGNFIINSFGENSISYVSVDTVFGVISVKKTLTKDSLKEAIENIKSVYSLQSNKIKNRLHYDIVVEPTLTYKDGMILNNIFSCIVSYQNKIVMKKKEEDYEYLSSDEIKKTFDDLTRNEWFSSLFIDNIYTTDGTFFFPIQLSEDKKNWQRNIIINKIGMQKKMIMPYIKENTITTDSELALAYTCDFGKPEKILGQFIMYLQYYTSHLVKSTPNISEIFSSLIDTPFFDIIQEREVSKLVTK